MPTRENLSPQAYDAWYHGARGAWMGEVETEALLRQGPIARDSHVLDIGCGSGWFSRRFSAAGAQVVGVDRDPAMLVAARAADTAISWVQADMNSLPFPDRQFDVVAAVTSLCFAADEAVALREMLRTARHTVLLGLLHRHSLLSLRKQGRGAYAGAHWHSRAEVALLLRDQREIASYTMETRLFWPGGARLGRWLEAVPGLARCFGGFMLVTIRLAQIK
jgi:SAM-dependent methyltransferase